MNGINSIITIANQKLISSKVYNKQQKNVKCILYKGLFYQIPKLNNVYSLELYLAQAPNINYYKAIFLENTDGSILCVFPQSLRPTMIIEKSFFKIHLKRIIETVGPIAFLNFVPDDIDLEDSQISYMVIEKTHYLIDPHKQKINIRKYILLMFILLIEYFVLSIYQVKLDESINNLNISFSSENQRLIQTKINNKTINEIPNKEEQNKILKEILKGIENAN